MPYSDFNLIKLEKQLGLKHKRGAVFERPLLKVEPSEHLISDINDGMDLPVFSEKAKSELLITPILREVRKKNIEKFTFFSGFALDIDSTKGLNGVCDYIFSSVPHAIEIQAPIFCLVEAKNRTIEEGYGQCAAEMYAARQYNLEYGKATEVMFGAVTNAFEWVFLKLENDTIVVDNERFAIKDLAELLGALQTIVDFYTV